MQYGLIYGSQGVTDRLVILPYEANVLNLYLIAQTGEGDMPPGKTQRIASDVCKHLLYEIISTRAGRLEAQAAGLR